MRIVNRTRQILVGGRVSYSLRKEAKMTKTNCVRVCTHTRYIYVHNYTLFVRLKSIGFYFLKFYNADDDDVNLYIIIYLMLRYPVTAYGIITGFPTVVMVTATTMAFVSSRIYIGIYNIYYMLREICSGCAELAAYNNVYT